MTNKQKTKKLVDASDWRRMDGDTDLEKQINSYLTCRFIMSKQMPSDECLDDAKDIISLLKRDIRKAVKDVVKEADI